MPILIERQTNHIFRSCSFSGRQRIPHGRSKDESGVKKPVVFIMHGFLQSSEAWVIRHKAEHGLPYILADQGFVDDNSSVLQKVFC